MRLMARLRGAAMTWGPLAVRSWWRSSPVTTSRTRWRRFSMARWPRAQEATSSGWASVGGREQNRVDHLGGPPPAAAALVDGSGAADPHHLGGAGQVDPGGRLDRFDGAPRPAPVGAVGDGGGGHVLPGRPLQLPFQARLVVLDRQEVVGAAGDDPLGGAPPGAHGVGGDDRTAGVQGGEQLGQGGDLVGLIRHSALSHDHSARPARGRQEVGGRVGAGAGPAHGLILHGDHSAAADGAHARAQPGRQTGVEVVGVHPLEHSADGGLTGRGPPLLQAQGLRVGRFQVGDVLAHRLQCAAPRQDPDHGQAQDRGQAVAHAPPVPRIGHAFQDLLQGPARQGGRGR